MFRFPAAIPRLAVGPTQPPMQQISGVGYFFLRVKRPGREAEHVTQLSAEVKNDCSCTSISAYAFMASRPPPPPYATVNDHSTYRYRYKALKNQVLVIPVEMPNCLNA